MCINETSQDYDGHPDFQMRYNLQAVVVSTLRTYSFKQIIVYPICVQIHHGTSSQGGHCKCAQSLCLIVSGIK